MSLVPEQLEGKGIFDWTVNDVCVWLDFFGMKQYQESIKRNMINGAELYELLEEDVEERLGVDKKPHRKKLFNGIKKLKYGQARKEQKEAVKAGGSKSTGLAIEKTTNVGRKKEKKAGLGVDLHANGKPYDFEVLCSFCPDPKNVSLVHCPACNDFLCEDHDAEVHHHVKRKNHIRTILTAYDMDFHAQKIINLLRVVGARRLLLRLCRKLFLRYYDAKNRQHYYFNTKTRLVQWHKPYCLRKLELCSFITPDAAAFKIQSLHRVRKARRRVVELIIEQFEKIYDRESGHFYYFYNGFPHVGPPTEDNPKCLPIKSKLVHEVQWKKPVNLYSKDCKVLFTRDLAALRIQFAFRTMKAKQFMRTLVRHFFRYHYDTITGKWFYLNTVNSHSMWRKPYMLGRELWDPDDVRMWGVSEVEYFFRRLGFKKYGYVEAIKDYAIDGRLLLTFEWEDYNYLGMHQSMHIKQILLQLHKRRWYSTHIDHPKDIERRDILRRHHNVDAAARILQKKFRQRYAVARVKALKEVIRLKLAKDEIERQRIEGQNWWPQRVLEHTGYDPRIKNNYGKRKVFKGVKGWGTYLGGKFVPAPEGYDDVHVSRWYTDKLEKKTGFTGDMSAALAKIDDKDDHLTLHGGGKKESTKRFN